MEAQWQKHCGKMEQLREGDLHEGRGREVKERVRLQREKIREIERGRMGTRRLGFNYLFLCMLYSVTLELKMVIT